MEESKWLLDEGLNIEYRISDFFELQPDNSFNEVRTCISHVAIHCMNDTRHGNDGHKDFRSYMFANQLSRLCPKIEHVIVSVPVNKDEFIMDNLTWLGDEKFIKSFEDSGFQLKDKLYDKKVNENLFDESERFTKSFPWQYCEKVRNVIGNYHFIKIEKEISS